MQHTLNHYPTFDNFLNGERSFSVLRVLSKENYLHNDKNKCESFDTLKEAKKYYNAIKNESKCNYIVITAIFEGTEIVKDFSKIKDCIKKAPLN
jgi:hypothetical protein